MSEQPLAEDYRTPRSITIHQDKNRVNITNDFGSEEVSDIIMIFALGMKGIALSVEQQNGVPRDLTLSTIAALAGLSDKGFTHNTYHRDDEGDQA